MSPLVASSSPASGIVSPDGQQRGRGLAQPGRRPLGHRADHPLRRRRPSPAASPARSKGFNVEDTSRPRKPGTWTPSSTTGWLPASQAVRDAGPADGRRARRGRPSASACMVGSGIGGLPLIERHARATTSSAARAASRRSSCRPRSST
jgi:hypothetical protein